ncbi:hypothetical protein BKA15_006384 [Microlunatus parietis]|uniref:Uncharacterized protein n=1 Tax=Microlunatus parietis TaxID=682979 RepID=A0A7Y9IE19_9ACTN|nr:hypothetical protein [Microlunatus parietis]
MSPLDRFTTLEESRHLAQELGTHDTSCLARGADSIFAEEVLAGGGALVAVLPSAGYAEAKGKTDDSDQDPDPFPSP